MARLYLKPKANMDQGASLKTGPKNKSSKGYMSITLF